MSTYDHDLCMLLVVREQHNYYRSAVTLPCHHDGVHLHAQQDAIAEADRP